MAIVRTAQFGEAGWRSYREVVTKRWGPREFSIRLRPEPDRSRGMGSGLHGLGLTSQQGGLLSTGAAVGTSAAVSSLAAGTALGSFAGPIGAGIGALVGIITGLFAASAARAKGATEENQAVNEYLPTWDQALQAIFAQANAGTITGAQAASMVPSLMAQWWAAAAQFKGLPGVADNSSGGANCGSYVSGQTTRCSPGHPCDKSCTAFCCVGCNDLWPSSLDAIAVLSNPAGGTLNTCTVYGSGYGATQRAGYSLTYTPPPAASAAGASAALASLGGSTGTILGLPWYVVVGAAALAAYELL
jgi:hypothetical protein